VYLEVALELYHGMRGARLWLIETNSEYGQLVEFEFGMKNLTLRNVEI